MGGEAGRDEREPLGRYADAALLILTSLAAGEKHGYAMMEDIAALTGVRIGPGTLYGALARLEERGWIVPLPAEERRRPYRLTESGAAFLRGQLAGMERLAMVGLLRLGASA